MIAKFRLLIFFSIFIFALTAYAEDRECSEDDPVACDVNMNLFCKEQGTVPFTLGITNDYKLGFTAQFASEPPAKKLPLFAVDGMVEEGKVSEIKVTDLICIEKVCRGSISDEQSDALEAKFNVHQSFINFVIRVGGKNGKDACIGKFTNNPELIEQNNSAKRVVCKFNPTTGNESVSGSGYFVPAGYGTEGDSFFNIALQGLPDGQTFKGCSIIGERRHRQVFEVSPVLLADVTDKKIYGRLSEAEQSEFDSRVGDYSYELFRDILLEQDPLNFNFSPSLGSINKGVSPSRGSNSVDESNKSTKEERKERKREKKKKGKRNLAQDILSLAANRDRESVLAWLNFDPLGGQLIIGKKCNADSLEDAVGIITCGEEAEDEDSKCLDISSSEDLSGTVCRDKFANTTRITVRLRASEESSYTVCLDGTPLSSKVDLSSAGEAYSGEVKLTSSTVLSEADQSYTFYEGDLTQVEEIKVSAGENCDSAIGSVEF